MAFTLQQTGVQGQAIANITLAAGVEQQWNPTPPLNVSSYSPVGPVTLVNHGANAAIVNRITTSAGTVGQQLTPSGTVNSSVYLEGPTPIFLYSAAGTTVSIIQD